MDHDGGQWGWTRRCVESVTTWGEKGGRDGAQEEVLEAEGGLYKAMFPQAKKVWQCACNN